jgi:hypothetical protein
MIGCHVILWKLVCIAILLLFCVFYENLCLRRCLFLVFFKTFLLNFQRPTITDGCYHRNFRRPTIADGRGYVDGSCHRYFCRPGGWRKLLVSGQLPSSAPGRRKLANFHQGPMKVSYLSLRNFRWLTEDIQKRMKKCFFSSALSYLSSAISRRKFLWLCSACPPLQILDFEPTKIPIV